MIGSAREEDALFLHDNQAVYRFALFDVVCTHARFVDIMHVGFDEPGFKVPAKKRPVVASCENQVRGLIVASTHDVITMTIFVVLGLGLDFFYNSFIGALTVVVPDVKFAVPSNGNEVGN